MKTFGCEIIHRQDNDSKPRKKNSFRFSFQIDGNNHHHNPKNSLPHAFDKCLTLCSPFWFSPHRNIWKPFTVEKAELLIHNIQAMWRWKINIFSSFPLPLSVFMYISFHVYSAPTHRHQIYAAECCCLGWTFHEKRKQAFVLHNVLFKIHSELSKEK